MQLNVKFFYPKRIAAKHVLCNLVLVLAIIIVIRKPEGDHNMDLNDENVNMMQEERVPK